LSFFGHDLIDGDNIVRRLVILSTFLAFAFAMILGCGKGAPMEMAEPMPKGRIPTGGKKFAAKFEEIRKKQQAMNQSAE